MYIHEPIHVSSYGTTVNIYAVVKERKDMSPFLTVLKKVCKMSDADRYAAFGESNFDKIIDKMESGAEFIDKYYEWEENNVITVGDEVIEKIDENTIHKPAKYWVTYMYDSGVISGIDNNGETYRFVKECVQKTGRHNDNIVELLKILGEYD